MVLSDTVGGCPLHRGIFPVVLWREVIVMVSLSDLIQLGILIVSIIALVYKIANKK